MELIFRKISQWDHFLRGGGDLIKFVS
jgi:hypothetical protein